MGPSNLSFENQIDQLVVLLQTLKPSQLTQKTLQELLVYVQAIPDQFYPPGFIGAMASKFSVGEDLIHRALNSANPRLTEDFDSLVPASGWLHDYIEYTRYTEPPTAFHFFAALTVLGSTLARRVYFPRGSGDIFPNLCCVLVAPPGKCKKTTACNLAVNLFRRIGGNVLADKITPEAIVESFQQQPTATGLIYAPEWSVFLGRQQYLEGLVPMLTALFDCPAIWTSATLMRGQTQLNNVALSHLAATTIDWMQSSITRDAFAGGFMSRLLFIVQKNTPRSFPLPPPLDSALGKRLVDTLLLLQHTNGEARLAPDAEKHYISWYKTRQNALTDKNFAGYYERKPDRLLQLSILLTIAADPKNLEISKQTIEHAEHLLLAVEHYLPAAFEELSSSLVGDDQHRLLRQLRTTGELGHSEWLRKNTTRMNSDTFRKCIETLKQANMVTFDSTKRRYYLLPAGRAIE